MNPNLRIHLTSLDVGRLEPALAFATRSESLLALEEQIESALVVPSAEIPPNVVTMRSRVRFRDERSREESEVTIVYPSEADPAQGWVSVLAPVGSALLGLTVGDIVDCPTTQGRSRRLRVLSIVYQPEAAGDLDL